MKNIFGVSSCEVKYLVSWPSICLGNSRIRPSITPLEHYILSLFDTLKEEKLKSKETIVHVALVFLLLESASLCPLEHILFFPILPLICELSIERWMIEVVEAQVEDSVYSVRRSIDRVCHYCISDLLIEMTFPVQFMGILNMNIESMDVFTCLYMIDYIC